MISFDLICAAGHRFEGWFGSSDDYNMQMDNGLIACPACGSADVAKALTAPNIGPKGNQSVSRSAAQEAEMAPAEPAVSMAGDELENVSNMPVMTPKMEKMLTKMADMQKKALEQSEWVGRKFADEARAIHYGESDERLIHGETSPEEADELADEGVSVAPLLFPYIPPEAKN